MPAVSRSCDVVERVPDSMFTMRFWHTGSMPTDFASCLMHWHATHGRHDLPWQTMGTRPDPYPVWVSEIMLQQTRVDTVIPYFQRFMARFPDISSLARADEDEVLALWSGLGYYGRARNLHAAARLIAQRHGGRFPYDHAAIQQLPGIGRSTAAAIGAFAFARRRAVLDGNVKRVLARVFGVAGWPGDRVVEARLWQLAESLLPRSGIRAYTQGIMDLGALLCTRTQPRCDVCPFAAECVAHREGRYRTLPGPRPGKALPEKTTAMLVMTHGGRVMLEKRPRSGIWGGLWSLPEHPAGEDMVHAAMHQGFQVLTCEPLPHVVHGFTHLRLHIRPWLVAVSRPTGIATPARVWLPLRALHDTALPAPVRRILAALAVSGGEASARDAA